MLNTTTLLLYFHSGYHCPHFLHIKYEDNFQFSIRLNTVRVQQETELGKFETTVILFLLFSIFIFHFDALILNLTESSSLSLFIFFEKLGINLMLNCFSYVLLNQLIIVCHLNDFKKFCFIFPTTHQKNPIS